MKVPYLSGLLLLCSLCFRTGAAQAGDAPLVFLHVTIIDLAHLLWNRIERSRLTEAAFPRFPIPGISTPKVTRGLSMGQGNF
jgi:hypothetical protein